MQSDWHRYNLKRRVASLPPLSSEIFTEKVLANKASAAATAARASYEKACAACNKTYYSENAFINHLSSQKHKLSVIRAAKIVDNIAEDDAKSVMSSTFSLPESTEKASTTGEIDEEAEEDFTKVVEGIKDTSLEDGDPVSRRPTRPHHSSVSQDDRTAHPISRTTTKETPSETSDAKPSGPIQSCLFCNYLSPDFSLNVHHMERHHSMFIPEKPYISDLEGLISYLHEKVTEGHVCLYCGKQKYTTDGIQTHMRDTGHCKIAYTTEEEMLELGDFYDFRGSYSDEEEDSEDAGSDSTTGGGVKLSKLGGHRKTTTTIEGQGADTLMGDGEGDEGWETDSTISDVPTDEITAIPVDDHSELYANLKNNRHHSHNDPRPHRNVDGFHSRAHTMPHAVYHDDYELHLPTGRTAGHRSLNKYYRQNLRNYPTASERIEREQRLLEAAESSDTEMAEDAQQQLQRRSNQHDRARQQLSRGNGGQGMIGVADDKKKEVRAVEKRERRRERRDQANLQWRNNKQSNSQKHFRDPLLQ